MLDARYGYARVSFKGTGKDGVPVEIIVGVELPVRYEDVRAGLQRATDYAFQHDSGDDALIAAGTESIIRLKWPGRSYFIEVGRGAQDEYVQVFEPKGHNGTSPADPVEFKPTPARTCCGIDTDYPCVDCPNLPVKIQRPQPESILEEAQRLVHGNRGADYGHPIDDYTRTGRLWSPILDGWLRQQPGFENIPPVPDLDPRIATLMMVAVKVSREVNKPKRDNRTDGAGYFECADMIANRQGV